MIRRAPWALALWLFANPSSAQDNQQTSLARSNPQSARAQASSHFQRGVSLFREGAYDAALVELRRAYQVLPDYRVLYNIAQTEVLVGGYVEAASAFEAYLQKGGVNVDAERRSDVEQELKELEKRIATLSINVDQYGANVFLDGHNVGTSPLVATIPVSAGRHHVTVQNDEGASASACVDLAGGEFKDLELQLTRSVSRMALARPVALPGARTGERAAAPASVPPQAPRRPAVAPGRGAERDDVLSTRDRWGVGLLSGAGAVALGAGAVGLGFTLEARATYREALVSARGDMTKVNAARQRLETYSRLTDGLAATALSLGVAGVVMLVVHEDASAEERQPRVALDVNVSPQGLAMAGQF